MGDGHSWPVVRGEECPSNTALETPVPQVDRAAVSHSLQPCPTRAAEGDDDGIGRDPGADFSTFEAISGGSDARRDSEISTFEAISEDRPEAEFLRRLQTQLERMYGTGRDDSRPGHEPGGAATGNALAKAVEQFTLRQRELSRQLDAHFGIDGARPVPDG
jgi:hypothetical protein